MIEELILYNDGNLIGFLNRELIDGKYVYSFRYNNIVNKIELLNNFPIIDKIYTSDRLFSCFLNRLPNKRRKDINVILQHYNLEEYDEWKLLIKTKGNLPIDKLEFK